MAMIDPEQERQRLAEFYAGQLDGELELVAEQAYELTDLAREALRTELIKRGLDARLAETAPVAPHATPAPGDPAPEIVQADVPAPKDVGEFDHRKMITVRRFRDLPEALLAKGGLESAGIQCELMDDNVVRMDWLLSNAVGGIRLQVDAEDAADSEGILSQPILERFEVSDIGGYDQPHCPKCGSLDINFQELSPAAYVSLWLNVPIPFHRRAWRCHSCNVEWEDDGVPGPAQSTA